MHMHDELVHIVETNDELAQLISLLKSEDVFLHVTCRDMDRHAANNGISLILFYFMESEQCWCLPINHNEAVCCEKNLTDVIAALKKTKRRKKIVWDKKNIIQLLGGDYNFIDVSIYRFLENGELPKDDQYTNAHLFVRNNFRTNNDLNICVPLYKHFRVFLNLVNEVKKINIKDMDDKGFLFINNTMSDLFAKIESNGLCISDEFTDVFGEEQNKHIKNNLVFSQYNLLTSTGRPSNRFAGVNYAALNKNDGSRNCFVSRHGNDGMLVMMDYNAFHPRLIAHLVNFKMDSSENPYAYLAKHYFNKENPTTEDILVSKGFTFTQIYGGIDKKWLHIPYFKKVQEYIDHRWKFFEENGYMETPKYGRKIKPCHIENPTPNKLFNYILQAFETEMAVDVLGELISYLDGKKTLPILYTYDSILFDAHKDDRVDVIKRIIKIMEQNNFPVKVYAGKNYGDMKQISL